VLYGPVNEMMTRRRHPEQLNRPDHKVGGFSLED
jgi:hypothetical protein